MPEPKQIIYADNVRKRLLDIQSEIKTMEERLPRLKSEHELLSGLLQTAVVIDFDDDTVPNAEALGPSDAVKQLLSKSPGLKTSEIVEILEDRIQTQSDQKRQLLYTIISHLRNRNHIFRDDEGRHFLIGAKPN